MCTAIAYHGSGFYFGRNMDLDCSFGERVVITPRNYRFAFRKTAPMDQHLALIGMAAVADGYPLYADAVNEKGLCMAGLNFPDNAYYPDRYEPKKQNVSPFELIPWVLGQCETLDDARNLLEETHLIAVPFSGALPLTPLHWMIADASGTLVLESTREGLQIYENPTGVLTNNPPFPFHVANLAHYAGLSNRMPPDSVFAALGTAPFGMGLGAVGLPGDFSSASRFVKAAWLCGLVTSVDGTECVSQVFRILGAVAPIKGTVLTADGKEHYTTYSVCIDTARGLYRYRTHERPETRTADIHSVELNGDRLSETGI